MKFTDLSEFDFELPEEQIAKFPASKRDQSRLLVIGRTKDFLTEEAEFTSILKYLKRGDVLVANHTRVSKRRVFLVTSTGRRHESLFLSEVQPGVWKTLLRNSKKLKIGDTLFDEVSRNFSFSVIGKQEEFTLVQAGTEWNEESFEKVGRTPIPPYFKRESSSEDDIRYQTVYSKNLGSVAAPTAGLHFTPELISKLQSNEIEFLDLELRVGYGTFQPLTEEHFSQKKLHEEFFLMPERTTQILNQAKKENRRIIAVGTTTLRALEASYQKEKNEFKVGEGSTTLFLQPGDPIQSCEGLITNFHLPESSLLLLVSAFSEKNRMMDAYRYAVQKGFRFFSYGDSMLILDP
ncbi:tRNA preQ1(34) S-adenosylmethionine ribosyltransferase-isomerase QueA [Leptospira semungkisensis]|uniref:S-adenosylmethionine:tRNA ribosyltransferase-isomerase n=1 Tax=Leptospira semungkisensis TaxID=2484985 RepID=A0A4R9FZR2_9LEPT|nr:tRNA preQ1(34) S-adenosylmethionine ribosyltransferase-isomerase QueA [Leptospira semungkisensis]TGK03970.1 tRNA preQ1(34) S-adenosylmethionine ribosyltransferase-isomerase QueA [Leptospira semungkisensis]